MKITLNKNSPPLGGLLVTNYVKNATKNALEVSWGETTAVDSFICRTSNDVARALSKGFLPQLYGASAIETTEVDHWLTFAVGPLSSKYDFFNALQVLDRSLAPVTYLTNKRLTIADFIVFATLYASKQFNDLSAKKAIPLNVQRWFSFIQSQEVVQQTINSLTPEQKATIYPVEKSSRAARNNADTKSNTTSGRAKEGKFIELPGAEMGKVVVRFPPEASGYLHIGHAKAALLNQYYQEAFKGKLIMRFDDTNPAKENPHFEKVILEDVEMLQIKPDMFTHTSQYFDLMLEYCEKLIKEGKAYVDDTEAEQMKLEREQKVESANRNNTVEKNLQIWEEMKRGSDIGQKYCVRAKIDMQSVNGCMRDPTIYRCKNEEHPRTGNKYKVYPTYDFACPIVDAIEGVTHTLRTMEYHDRDAQFYWFIDALGLRKPYIWEYSRLSMTNTVLSKRKLTWFVNEGLVDGWDDPRMPTVRGVLRRGMTVEGLKEFIIAQGSSRSVVFMEWDKIWAFNKKIIDPIAPRYTVVSNNEPVPVLVNGVREEVLTVPSHPKNPDVGTKETWIGPKVLIDRADAECLKEGENATFINWGNLLIKKINKKHGKITSVEAVPNLENKDYKKTLKLTWLAETEKAPFTQTYCIYFDHLLSKALLGKDEDFKQFVGHETRKEVQVLGDPELRKLKKGDIIQIQRKGFFKVDVAYESSSPFTGRAQPVVLFYVPDGSTKEPALGAPQSAAPKKKVTTVGPPAQSAVANGRAGGEELGARVQAQADKVLSSQKKEFKNLTDTDFVRSKVTSPPAADVSIINPRPVNVSVNENSLLAEIVEQGDKVRQLKTAKAEKSAVDAEVQTLLKLKGQFKSLTGKDWKPGMNPAQGSAPPVVRSAVGDGAKEAIVAKVTEQGNLVRELKAKKTSKEQIDAAVKALLDLKAEYKKVTGEDFPAPAKPPSKAKESKPKEVKEKSAKQKPSQKEKKTVNIDDTGLKKQTRLGLEAKKDEALSDWYSQVITKGELIEYYDVSGCYILRPWSFAIWEVIRDWFDAEIKKLGVQNCYFPIFVSKAMLEREKDHIADFSPEVAWVTKSGDSDMAEPIAVRPTSETVMYPAYAKWIQSYRDLPIKLNQWNNVVRWEFKHPQPFIRTREFLWQEGHSAFAFEAEAFEEVTTILELYAQVYEDLLAIPVVKGRKTEKEKFAGGDYTLTVEAFISCSGRGIQGATSHHLGRNFSKMFELIYEDPETQEKKYVYQNSWGITTRTIGVMIMVHADNQGLVLPPNVASIQVVIVPCGITANLSDDGKKTLQESCDSLENDLKRIGVKVKGDHRQNYSPGWKFNHWELKGVPIRIELGPKDIEKKQLVAVRRDTGEKLTLPRESAAGKIQELLKEIQNSLFNRAMEDLNSHKVVLTDWSEFSSNLDKRNIILAPSCGGVACEDKIKIDSSRDEDADSGAPSSGAKALCIPLDQPGKIKSTDKCIHPECKNPPKHYTLFGRSY